MDKNTQKVKRTRRQNIVEEKNSIALFRTSQINEKNRFFITKLKRDSKLVIFGNELLYF
jgi:hypothetical protein